MVKYDPTPGLPKPSTVRSIWDGRYARLNEIVATSEPDSWLGRWGIVLADVSGASVLDLGCGRGRDSRFLLAEGFEVTSLDFSIEALNRAREHGLARGRQIQSDVTDGIPFKSRAFGLIIANLVLHYFRWHDTVNLMGELARSLEPGGKILVRVNSTDDHEFGGAGNPEIEPGLCLVEGVAKRFFDRESVTRLFDEEWRLLDVFERTSIRDSRTKRLWEACAERRVSDR